jgi:diaminopimelate decarboxylase
MQPPPSAADLPAYPPDRLPAHVRAAISAAAGDPARPVSGYFYDLPVAAELARGLRAALPGWAEVFYAVKANSYPPILDALAPHVDGFEVASAREAELASDVKPRMVGAGPGKSMPLLTRLIELGVEVINVESLLELHRVNRAAEVAGRRVQVAIRVNPTRIDVAGSLVMGGTATQFGLPETDVPAAIALAKSLPALGLVGFHIHAVCNNLDAEAHARYLRWCLTWSVETARAHGVDLRLVDVGGGLGVPFEDEDPFDVARFGALLGEIRPPAGVRVVFEPGRYLVTECGYYAAEVTDLKHAYGTTFAILRGGINHFQLPTSWDIIHNFAVLPIDAWPDPFPRPGVQDASITVVGELCTPEDTLARDVKVGRVRAGDVVVFPMAGSYGYEFAMPEFLGHPAATRQPVRPA